MRAKLKGVITKMERDEGASSVRLGVRALGFVEGDGPSDVRAIDSTTELTLRLRFAENIKIGQTIYVDIRAED